MRRARRLAAAALAAAILATAPPAPEQASGGPAPTGFSRQQAMDHVRELAAGIGPRLRGTPEERQAARYVARTLRSYGYRVRVQRFGVDGRRSRNVVAWWPGSLRFPVVVGAHLDTVRGSPGANDNASGVAVLLEVARLLAGTEPARFLRLVAFGAEEYGPDGRHHVGSRVFVNRLGPDGRRRLAGMVSVDMVADGRPLVLGTLGLGPRILARILHRRVRAVGIGAVLRTTCDCSDNGPFEGAGIPAVWMWSGPDPDHHEPSDTVANMERRDLRRTGRALLAFAKHLDRELIRRLRRS